MEPVLISGLPASGKTTLAEKLAKKLGLKTASGSQILIELAKEHGYKPATANWWDTPDGMKFLHERASNPEYDMEVDKRLIEIASKGDVVITSYTLPWLTDFGIKIWLEASPEERAKRLAQRDGLSLEEAKEIIKQRDIENKDLYEKLYGIHLGSDFSPFHIVLDVNRLSADEVAKNVIEKIRKVEK
ncbi:MAG: AAA family ATPase [Candidatus Micrarchaeia archaeon]